MELSYSITNEANEFLTIIWTLIRTNEKTSHSQLRHQQKVEDLTNII